MAPCVRLHTQHGHHVPGCTCTRECPDHDAHCSGCLPVEAERGLLCLTDSRRLRGHLGAEQGLDQEHPVHGLPWAWEHLAEAYPSLSQAPSSGGSSIGDPEADRLASVVSLRDDIHATLAQWVGTLAEQAHLHGPGLVVTIPTAPDDARAQVQRIQVRRFAAWLLANIEPLESAAGVKASDLDVAAMLAPGAGALAATEEDVEQHLAELRALQVLAVLEELGDLMSRAHALAPWRPAPTHLDGIPCRCGAISLHDHGDEVVCWTCRRPYSRDEYRILVKVMARRFQPEVQHA